MQLLQTLVNGMLGLGSTVVLPIIMFLIGLLFGVDWKKSFSAGLMLGVAFAGMGAILGFMIGAISPAASAMVKNTGRNLTNLDLGWTPTAAIAWSWSFAFLMFPLEIAINIVMLALNWTRCLNVDMWNVWNLVFTGVLVSGISGSVPLAFVMCGIQAVLQLKQADYSCYQIEELTGIKGVALPHSLFFTSILMVPVRDFLLKFIPGLKNVRMGPEELRDKIGVFGENHVLGFFVGAFIGILARYSVKDILALAVNAGTGLTLFPMVARLFITALMPIADGAKDFMAKRFPGREFSIGLDWPFTAGLSSMWVAAILNVPWMLFLAFVLPGNTALPYGGILNLCATITACIICQNDVLQTLILTFLFQPLWLYAGTVFAAPLTALAKKVGTVTMPEGGLGLTWASMEMPEYRLTATYVANIFTKGQIFPGIVFLPILAAAWFYTYTVMTKRDHEAGVRLGYYKE